MTTIQKKILGYSTAALASFALLLAGIIIPALIFRRSAPFAGTLGAVLCFAIIKFTWKTILSMFGLGDASSERAVNVESAHNASGMAESIRDLKYNISGGDVEFADGLKGKIISYSGYYNMCSVVTDDNFELLYKDFDFAVAALHAYLVDKTELQDGLYEKRPYKK